MLAMRKALRALTGVGAMSLSALVPLELVGLGSPPAPLLAIATAPSRTAGDIRRPPRRNGPSPRPQPRGVDRRTGLRPLRR